MEYCLPCAQFELAPFLHFFSARPCLCGHAGAGPLAPACGRTRPACVCGLIESPEAAATPRQEQGILPDPYAMLHGAALSLLSGIPGPPASRAKLQWHCHKTAQGRQPDGPSGLACRRRHTPCTPATKALQGRPGCPALPGASGTVTWPTFTLANTMHKESKGGGHMQACLAAASGLPSRAAAQHRPRSLIEPQHRTHRAPPATPGSACGRGRGRGVPRAGPPAAPLILASTHKPALLTLTLQSRLVH